MKKKIVSLPTAEYQAFLKTWKRMNIINDVTTIITILSVFAIIILWIMMINVGIMIAGVIAAVFGLATIYTNERKDAIWKKYGGNSIKYERRKK